MSKKKRNVLIIGSGAREHALAWKISQSPHLNKLFMVPGNGGNDKLAQSVNIAETDLKGLVKFAMETNIDLTIVGKDEPLALGIVDVFRKANLKIFGPNKKAASIESSKAFSKTFMKKNKIPTAVFKVFTQQKIAQKYIETQKLPIVVKASGLAGGKGVFVCQTLNEAENALDQIFCKKVFGGSGDKVIIEDYLEGQEISIHAITDGTSSVVFPPSQDHKANFDGDIGPNTGGMGSFAPVPWVRKSLFNSIEQTILKPTFIALNKEVGFTGCLFPGLKITPSGPKVLEYNARFGDPETQVYMRLLKTDLLEVFNACVNGTLEKTNLTWFKGYAVCIVLASKGYPGNYKTGFEIKGIEKAEKLPGVVVFHAGTKKVNGKLVTAGGRVLSVTANGKTLQSAVDRAYQAVKLISFQGMHFRKDIAKKSLI